MSFEFKSAKCWVAGICAVEWYALNWISQAILKLFTDTSLFVSKICQILNSASAITKYPELVKYI